MIFFDNIFKDTGREVKTNNTVTNKKWKEQNKRCDLTMVHIHDIQRCGQTYLVLNADVSASLYQQRHNCLISAPSSKVERRTSFLVCTELDAITEEGKIDIFVSAIRI